MAARADNKMARDPSFMSVADAMAAWESKPMTAQPCLRFSCLSSATPSFGPSVVSIDVGSGAGAGSSRSSAAGTVVRLTDQQGKVADLTLQASSPLTIENLGHIVFLNRCKYIVRIQLMSLRSLRQSQVKLEEVIVIGNASHLLVCQLSVLGLHSILSTVPPDDVLDEGWDADIDYNDLYAHVKAASEVKAKKKLAVRLVDAVTALVQSSAIPDTLALLEEQVDEELVTRYALDDHMTELRNVDFFGFGAEQLAAVQTIAEGMGVNKHALRLNRRDKGRDICLMKHQQAAVLRMYQLEQDAAFRGGLLCEEMGLGKTAMLFALLCYRDGLGNAADAGALKRRPQEVKSMLPLQHLQVDAGLSTLPPTDAKSRTRVIAGRTTLLICPSNLVHQTYKEAQRWVKGIQAMKLTEEELFLQSEVAHEQLLQQIAKCDLVIVSFDDVERSNSGRRIPWKPDLNLLKEGLHVRYQRKDGSVETGEVLHLPSCLGKGVSGTNRITTGGNVNMNDDYMVVKVPYEHTKSGNRYISIDDILRIEEAAGLSKDAEIVNVLDHILFQRSVIDEFQEGSRAFKLETTRHIHAQFRWCISGTPFTEDADVNGILSFLCHPMSEPLQLGMGRDHHGSALRYLLQLARANTSGTPLPEHVLAKLGDRIILKNVMLPLLLPILIRQFPRVTLSTEKIEKLKLKIQIAVPKEVRDLVDNTMIKGFLMHDESREGRYPIEGLDAYGNPPLLVPLLPKQQRNYESILALECEKNHRTVRPLRRLMDQSMSISDDSMFRFSYKSNALVDILSAITKKKESAVVFYDFSKTEGALRMAFKEGQIKAIFKPSDAQLDSFREGTSRANVLAVDITNDTVSGLNLQVCDHVIFTAPVLDTWRVDQAIGRAFRLGREGIVSVWFLIGETKLEIWSLLRLLTRLADEGGIAMDRDLGSDATPFPVQHVLRQLHQGTLFMEGVRVPALAAERRVALSKSLWNRQRQYYTREGFDTLDDCTLPCVQGKDLGVGLFMGQFWNELPWSGAFMPAKSKVEQFYQKQGNRRTGLLPLTIGSTAKALVHARASKAAAEWLEKPFREDMEDADPSSEEDEEKEGKEEEESTTEMRRRKNPRRVVVEEEHNEREEAVKEEKEGDDGYRGRRRPAAPEPASMVVEEMKGMKRSRDMRRSGSVQEVVSVIATQPMVVNRSNGEVDCSADYVINELAQDVPLLELLGALNRALLSKGKSLRGLTFKATEDFSADFASWSASVEPPASYFVIVKMCRVHAGLIAKHRTEALSSRALVSLGRNALLADTMLAPDQDEPIADNADTVFICAKVTWFP